MTALVQARGLTNRFGATTALDDVSLEIPQGRIVGLIGPNGAGKTTIFNLITGIYTPTEGDIYFGGKRITGMRPNRIAAQGLARTFQEMRLWRHMTVLEHVMMARYSKLTYGLLGAWFDTPERQRQEEEAEVKAMEYMKMLGVDQHAKSLVGNLPYGAARRVEMARALATEPQILFLDEPTVGMTQDELMDIISVIKGIHEKLGLAIFLIEHRQTVVTELCPRVQALVFGEAIAEGHPDEVRNKPEVVEAYLGKQKVDQC